MARFYNKKYSLVGLAAVAVVGGAYLVYKTFPHLTESESKEDKIPINFDELSDEELKSLLAQKQISAPEDSTREDLLSLAKSL